MPDTPSIPRPCPGEATGEDRGCLVGPRAQSAVAGAGKRARGKMVVLKAASVGGHPVEGEVEEA